MAMYILCFENQKSFVQYYFEGVIKLFVNINICIRNFQLICVILKKICVFLFTNIGIIIFAIAILKEIKFIIISIYLRCCKISKVYSSNSSNISDYFKLKLKLHQLSIIPEQLRIGSQSRKCQKMIEWKLRVQKLRRFDIETTQKNPRGELIDISSILKVEFTSKFPRRINVIISTWICLSKLM